MQDPEPVTPQPPKPPSVGEIPLLTADDHLKHLLIAETEETWYRSLVQNVKDAIRPPKLPPLELTSKPVAVKSIWGDYRYGKQAGASSTVIHIVAVILMFTLAGSKTVRDAVVHTATLVAPADWDLTPPPQKPQGGGGGGDRSPLPASKGQAPKFAPRQFVPPQQVVNNPNPQLLMEPTLVGPSEIRLPNVNLPVWGDPNAKIGPYSNGPGSGGGIGSGSGGGIGPGRGPGYGPGEGGGIGGGVYRVGGGVSAPVAIYKIEPEYSEEARKAKFQGTVVLSIVVDEQGLPRNFKVVKPLGLGLDEKAIEAVQKWRFSPAKLNGKPVAVLATVEVNFRLL